MSTISPELFDTSKPPVPEPAQREPAALFRYSTWVHVGVGAEDCPEVDEDGGENLCGDRGHFHAWCRLANPLQQAEIRERALAARARKIRQLRDPESDAYAILQEEFDSMSREGEPARQRAVDELLLLDFWRDYYAAMQEARQIDDEDEQPPENASDDWEPPKLFAHTDDDQARFMRLSALSEDQRPKDEYEELQRHLARYQEAIDTAMKARTEPKRSALDQLELPLLIEQLRDKRIENEAHNEFRRVYEVHEWLACAYRQPNGPPVLNDLGALELAAPEIIDGLQSAFADLKATAQEASGN